MSSYLKYDDTSDMDDTEEKIFILKGNLSKDNHTQTMQGNLSKDINISKHNTWDFDDSVYEEDYSSITGWI